MAEVKRHIAFDLGAESGRAVAGWLENGRLTMEELHRFPTQSMTLGATVRWNVYRFYEEMLAALGKYAQKYGEELSSVGVDAWGDDYGLLDAEGNLIELPYCYRDARTAGTDALLEKTVGKSRVYALTGGQFLIFNTLNQLIASVRSGSKALREADKLLFIADLLHNFLCGSVCTEYTAPSITQLMDTRTERWVDELFRAFQIPQHFLPPIVHAGDTVGTLYAHLAAQAGLRAGVKVIAPAVHDTASAAAAVPAQGEDWAYISMGTWCIAGLETDAPIINEEGCRLSLSNSAGAFGKNLFLKNVMGLWVIQQCRKAWNRQVPLLDYAGITRLAEQAAPFAAFIDPDDEMFFSPQNGVEAIIQYLKKTGQSTRPAESVGGAARLVFEGLALKYRYVLDKLKTVAGQKITRLHLIGGGIQNTLLCQFTANALGVQTLAGPVEATAAGNLLLQAYGCGEIGSLGELRTVAARTAALKEYQPQETERWRQAFEQYKQICGLE
jgi:rhamnulokinase